MKRLFYDNVKYRLRGSRKALKLIEKVIRNNNRISGDLNFILVEDKAILKLNRKYLKHNYHTDVIAFGEEDNNSINGDIYISVDTVKRNAHNYKVSLKEEILRVMIHGTLHLCGFIDGTKEQRENMKKMEDRWIMEFERLE